MKTGFLVAVAFVDVLFIALFNHLLILKALLIWLLLAFAIFYDIMK